jgi:hypothetical protein
MMNLSCDKSCHKFSSQEGQLGVLKILLLAVEYAVKAVNFYHTTPEGRAAADELFGMIEAEGVDIPFWQPGMSGSGDMPGSGSALASVMSGGKS